MKNTSQLELVPEAAQNARGLLEFGEALQAITKFRKGLEHDDLIQPRQPSKFGTCNERVELFEFLDVRLDRLQVLAHRDELRQDVLVHLTPMRLVVLADRVAQLSLGHLVRGQGFLLLELGPKLLLLIDRLTGALAVGLELLDHRGEPRFVVGADARAHMARRRVRRVIQAGDPGLVLAPLLQQALDHGRAFRRPLRHLAPVVRLLVAPRGAPRRRRSARPARRAPARRR